MAWLVSLYLIRARQPGSSSLVPGASLQE